MSVKNRHQMQITFQLVVHELQQQIIHFRKIFTDALNST